MQNQPNFWDNKEREDNRRESHVYIDLVYADVPLDPEFPVSNIRGSTHSPDSGPLTHLHYHKSLEIGYCFHGSGIFIVDDKIMPFSKGCASIIFKNEIHIAKSNPEDPSCWFFANLDPVALLKDFGDPQLHSLFPCLEGSRDFSNIIMPEDDSGLVPVIIQMVEEIQCAKALFNYSAKGLTLSLLARLSRLIPDEGRDLSRSYHSGLIRLSPALEHIFKHYNEKISIPKLAEISNMSITNFRRIFTKSMGISPIDYLNKVRIHMTSVLLATSSLFIVEISVLSGFESLSNFNRHFKALMKKAPRDWRSESHSKFF